MQFFQGGGDFNRGLRKWIAAGYAQDEFRVSPRLTLNLGLRYEVNTPYTDIRNRMNAWAPGQQSTVYPNAPEGCCSPAILACRRASPPSTITNSCRAWAWPGIRSATARRSCGPATASSTTASPMAWAVRCRPPSARCRGPRLYQLAGPGFNLANPYGGAAAPFGGRTFVQPATILTVQPGMLPPYSQNWNLSIERTHREGLSARRSLCRQQRHPPAALHRSEPLYLRLRRQCENTEQRASTPTVTPPAFATTRSVGLDRRRFQLHLPRAAGRLFAAVRARPELPGILLVLEESRLYLLAERRRLGAHAGGRRERSGAESLRPGAPSTAHRCSMPSTVSCSAEARRCRYWRGASRARAFIVNGWQLNAIASLSTGTPFTVYDSANVSLQGARPRSPASTPAGRT